MSSNGRWSNTRGPSLQLLDPLDNTAAANLLIEKKPKSAPLPTMQEAERDLILQALDKSRWRIEGPHGAALILGMKPSTLRNRMRKHGIKRY